MPRLLPSIEVRPLAGLLWYGLAFMIIVGVALAGVGGGLAVWVGFWLVVAVIAYIVVKNTWGRIA